MSAAEQGWPEIIVFGTSWCGDCRRTLQLLDHHDVPYRYHDIDEEKLEELVISLNEKSGHGARRWVPTLKVGERILSVPSNAELSELLGL